tara:strand:- start:5656 stop:6558 length:903 start_codon:yes stop_codon:yes gene_type:complete
LFPLAIFIGGPTASHKTEIAFDLQSKFPSFIVNSDSMQVYDQLEILTNKPIKKFQKKHECNLFSYIKYPKKCNVGSWQKKALSIIKNKKNKIPIFVGGTGLYIDSIINNISEVPKISSKVKERVATLLKNFGINYLYKELEKIDEEYSKKLSPNDTQRIVRALEVNLSTETNFSEWYKIERSQVFKKIIYIVVKTEREKLYSRINQRCEKMIDLGVLDEVKQFLQIKQNLEHPIHKSIGLRQIIRYLEGINSLEETKLDFMQETRRYAKRQLTWFNNRAKEAIHIEGSKIKQYVLKELKL